MGVRDPGIAELRSMRVVERLPLQLLQPPLEREHLRRGHAHLGDHKDASTAVALALVTQTVPTPECLLDEVVEAHPAGAPRVVAQLTLCRGGEERGQLLVLRADDGGGLGQRVIRLIGDGLLERGLQALLECGVDCARRAGERARRACLAAKPLRALPLEHGKLVNQGLGPVEKGLQAGGDAGLDRRGRRCIGAHGRSPLEHLADEPVDVPRLAQRRQPPVMHAHGLGDPDEGQDVLVVGCPRGGAVGSAASSLCDEPLAQHTERAAPES
eukprot:scaffold51067_cov66-Phaeocystis_antarctica.AAC.5